MGLAPCCVAPDDVAERNMLLNWSMACFWAKLPANPFTEDMMLPVLPMRHLKLESPLVMLWG